MWTGFSGSLQLQGPDSLKNNVHMSSRTEEVANLGLKFTEVGVEELAKAGITAGNGDHHQL